MAEAVLSRCGVCWVLTDPQPQPGSPSLGPREDGPGLRDAAYFCVLKACTGTTRLVPPAPLQLTGDGLHACV